MFDEIFDCLEIVDVNVGVFRHETKIIGFAVAAGHNRYGAACDRVCQLLGHIVVTVRVLDRDHEFVLGKQLNVAFHVLARVIESIAQAEAVRMHRH